MENTAKFQKNGNIKLGGSVWTFSKLAGNGYIAGCKGTCGGHCKGCYNPDDPKRSPCFAFKSYRMYGWDKSTVAQCHIRNTKAFRSDIRKSFADLDSQISRAKHKPSVVRINAVGELETLPELMNWGALATKHPETNFYLYTKNYDLLDQLFEIVKALPKNFFINISIWHDSGKEAYGKYSHIKNVRAFVYDDKTDPGISSLPHCPAYSSNGKMNHSITCDKCGLCFSDKCKKLACYDH